MAPISAYQAPKRHSSRPYDQARYCLALPVTSSPRVRESTPSLSLRDGEGTSQSRATPGPIRAALAGQGARG